MFNCTSTSGVLVCNYFYLRTGTLDITLSSFHNRLLVCATTVLPSTTLAATAYAYALDRQSSSAITTISHIDNKTATTTATTITTKDHNQTNTGLATAATTTTAHPCQRHQPQQRTHKPLSSTASHCHPCRNRDRAVATALASAIATTTATATTTTTSPSYHQLPLPPLTTKTTATTMATTATDTHQSCHDNWQLANAAVIDPPYLGRGHSLSGSVNPYALNGTYRQKTYQRQRLR